MSNLHVGRDADLRSYCPQPARHQPKLQDQEHGASVFGTMCLFSPLPSLRSYQIKLFGNRGNCR